MGRITVFALEECPHCKRAKCALKERNIPYTEISLSTHPFRRNDMLSLSDRLTVPQVFFGEKHIGGADDTLALLQEWDDQINSNNKTPLERYEVEIGAQPDPTDPRLRISTEPPVVPKAAPVRPECDKIELPDGSKASVLETMERLKEALPHDELPYNLKIYKDCFTGAACVSALMKGYECSEEAAIVLGQHLQQRQLLHHVVYDHEFSNTKDYYFRLQCFQSPEVLNSYRVWTTTAAAAAAATATADTSAEHDKENTATDNDNNKDDVEDAVDMVTRLKKLLGKIESAVTNDQGEVNYKAALNHELFSVFEEAVCELQTVDMGGMDRNAKLAFGINLYNLMIKFAFMKVGIGSSSMNRSSFFTMVKFNIGGHLYSFQELENGILRGNRRAPYSLSKPISKNDPRYQFVLKPEEVDERIHFALNCGAKSCPPVKSFTTEGIEEELRIVAQAFAEDDGNCQVDVESRKLYLNKILSWYMVDFAATEEELPTKVVDYLRGEKKEQLQTMLDDDPKSISVKFMSYDWGTNASDFQEFDAGNLQAQYYSVYALWS